MLSDPQIFGRCRRLAHLSEVVAGPRSRKQRDGLGQYWALPRVWLQSLLSAGSASHEIVRRDGAVAGTGRRASWFAKMARRHERSYAGRERMAVRGRLDHCRLFRIRHSLAWRVDRLQLFSLAQRATLVRTDAGFTELEQRQRRTLRMGKSHQKPRLRADLSKVNPQRIGRQRVVAAGPYRQ